MLDKTLFRGNKLAKGSSNPYHVLRVFMKLLPNARGAFKNTLDRDQLALRNKIKASGGPKEQDAAAGSGTAAQAWSGDTHRSSTNNDNYVSTAPVPAPDPMDRPRRGGNKLPHTGQLKARGAVAVRRAVQEVVQAGVGSVAVVMAVRSERPTAGTRQPSTCHSPALREDLPRASLGRLEVYCSKAWARLRRHAQSIQRSTKRMYKDATKYGVGPLAGVGGLL